MPREFQDRETILKYLLYELSQTERDVVEEHFLFSDDYFAQITEIEDDLIHEYVSGTLSADLTTRLNISRTRSSSLNRKVLEMQALLRLGAERSVRVPEPRAARIEKSSPDQELEKVAFAAMYPTSTSSPPSLEISFAQELLDQYEINKGPVAARVERPLPERSAQVDRTVTSQTFFFYLANLFDFARQRVAIILGVISITLAILSADLFRRLANTERQVSDFRSSEVTVRSENAKMRDDIARLQSRAEKAENDLRENAKLGVTIQELSASRKFAEMLQAEQESAKQQFTVEVKTVGANLDATRKDLVDSRREITDVRTSLSAQIARNGSELADLRKKGERDYFEFDIQKPKKTELTRVADIQLQLRKTDPKKSKYDLLIQVDDSRLEKKDRTANEPVQFLVGRDKLRYEVVVNYVDKDRIRGYLSTPKDKALPIVQDLLREARTLIENGQYKAARSKISDALTKEPQNQDARDLLARISRLEPVDQEGK